MSGLLFRANSKPMRAILTGLFAIALYVGAFAGPAWSQRTVKEAKPAPAANDAVRRGWTGDRLRFVTDSDFPPFNYYDEEGVLIGFNVDLARALCAELSVECDIQMRDWSELLDVLDRGEADAVIASHAISAANLAKADLTNRYFQIPARFVSRADLALDTVVPETLEGRTVAVQKGTAHEAFLQDFFKQAKVVSLPTAEAARDALRTGKADLLFGDGISLMFWISGAASEGCCSFRGGAFTESKYFGEGSGIVVKKGNWPLRDILNGALLKVRKDGRFEELLLRYFPLRFY